MLDRHRFLQKLGAGVLETLDGPSGLCGTRDLRPARQMPECVCQRTYAWFERNLPNLYLLNAISKVPTLFFRPMAKSGLYHLYSG